jgi:hypothetical protein
MLKNKLFWYFCMMSALWPDGFSSYPDYYFL